jgi:methionine-rich copper-binding protein CopC
MNASSKFMAVICSGFIASLFFTATSKAQHETHAILNNGSVHVVTLPDDDEVLADAPTSIMLHFESRVSLLKLALKEPGQGKEPLDIGFRYRPETAVHFEHALPSLLPADYYLVEWTAFAANGELVKGSFYFSFGEDAMPPSYYREQMEHSATIISPDYRLIQ